jgi:hypothetical protein
MTKPHLEVPKPTAADHVHALARAGVAYVPIIGNAAAELFDNIITPPLEKRREAWRESVGQRLLELEEREQISIEDLQSNEEFITAATRASQAAMRAHHESKLDALRNAILNSARPGAPSDIFQQLFIQWVDELTVDHLRFLLLFRDPQGWFRKNNKQPPSFTIGSSLSQVLENAYPDLGGNRTLYELVASDLEARKLFSGSMHTMMSANGAWAKRTTTLGDQFVDYISPPSL